MLRLGVDRVLTEAGPLEESREAPSRGRADPQTSQRTAHVLERGLVRSPGNPRGVEGMFHLGVCTDDRLTGVCLSLDLVD